MTDDISATGSGAEAMLGKAQTYPDTYSPGLLFPIGRQSARERLFGEQAEVPFHGVDLWSAYEVSWLNAMGKPQVATAEFSFPADSPNIIESKSFKYYLNSLNQNRFGSADQVAEVLTQDLSAAAGADVGVQLQSLSREAVLTAHLPGVCVDNVETDERVFVYVPSADLLRSEPGEQVVGEALYSHLLKTNCPVTGQPDWATVWLQYSGPKIDPESFLRYVVSFRQHQDFHENCVEQIFCDVLSRCKAEELTVYARYTRRGGLDINPFRTNTRFAAPAWRLLRQ